MNLPSAIPAWMPGWLFLALVIPAMLWFLAFLMVPFSVFGVKARLETLENELQELNEQIRVMQMRVLGSLPAMPQARSAELPAHSTPSSVRNAAIQDDLPNFAQLKRTRQDTALPTRDPSPTREPPLKPNRPPIPTPQPRGSLGSFGGRDAMVPRERPAVPPRPRRTEPRLD